MNLDLKLNDFEGPLDLLLHLIKENKMDIFDIQIEKITEQYLEYIRKQESMNLEVDSEYLVLASELIEIKSRWLLPREKKEDTEEEIDPREELINRLLEYEAYKEITKTLKEKEQIRMEIYTKAPSDITEYMEEDTNLNMDITLDDLVDAFQKFLERQKQSKPLATKVTENEITVWADPCNRSEQQNSRYPEQPSLHHDPHGWNPSGRRYRGSWRGSGCRH